MEVFHDAYEGKLIRFGTVVFWTLFWLFNVVDKFINKPVFLFAGKDRIIQFTNYFASIGIENMGVVMGFLWFIAIVEIIAFILVASALWNLLIKNEGRAHQFFFWGTFAGLAIFSFFTIGDQIFGERSELLEHTIFWLALIISWGAYTYFPRSAVSQGKL